MSFKEFLESNEVQAEKKPVKIAGRTFWVIEMNASERDDFEASQLESNRAGTALVNFRARLLARVMVDEEGKRVAKTEEDVVALGKRPAREIMKAFNVATKLNAVTDEDVEELAKKS